MNAQRMTLRGIVAPVVAFVVLTIALTYPLAIHLGDFLPDSGDSYEYAWVLGFGANQLIHDPLHLYDGNILYPFPLSLAYSDSTLPNVALSAPIIWLTGNPILANNLMILLTFFAGGLGMYLFVVDRTRSRHAALIAGIIYGFGPFRFDHLAQLPNVSMEWAPFTLWTFDRFVATGRQRWIAGFALTGLLQVLVSFYYAFILGLGILLHVVVRIARQPRVLRHRSQVVPLVGWIGVAAAATFVAVRPYFEVRQAFGFERTLGEAEHYSAWPANFLAATPTIRLVLIQPLLHSIAARDPTLEIGTPERYLYPGLLAVVLALFALTRIHWSRSLAPTLMILAGVILAFGPTFHPRNGASVSLPFPLPYTLLFEYLPGFSALRVPSRFAALVMLGLAILAGDGAAWLIQSVRSGEFQIVRQQVLAQVVGLGAIAIVVVESLNAMPLSPVNSGSNVPEVYRWLAMQPHPSPVLEIPIDVNAFHQSPLSYYSTYDQQPLVNGSRSFLPSAYVEMVQTFSAFPSRKATEAIARLGIRYVVVHRAEPLGATVASALVGNPDVRRVNQFGADDVFEIARQPTGPQMINLVATPPCLPKAGDTGVVTVALDPDDGAKVAILRSGSKDLSFKLDWQGKSGESFQETVQAPVPASVVRLPSSLALSFHPPVRADVYTLTISTIDSNVVGRAVIEPAIAVGSSPRDTSNPAPRLVAGRLLSTGRRAADDIPFELSWQLDNPTSAPLIAFVNAYDDQGRYWSFPVDAPPRFDRSLPCPGSVLVDSQRVRLRAETPPGVYRVETGIVNELTGQRVPFIGPNGDRVAKVDLGTFRVLADNVFPDEPLPTNAAEQQVFGNAIVLDRAQVAGTLKPGSDLAVDLRWLSRRSVSIDYTLFVHLTDPTGRVIAQIDRQPGGSAFPTSAWLPDDVLVERELLPVPPSLPTGTYEIRVGLYEVKTMQRSPPVVDGASTGNDYVRVAELSH